MTGFYSGNDKKYLRPISKDVKNAKKYRIVNDELICKDYAQRKDILNGIRGKRRFIPIVKGGGVKYRKSDSWYVDWSVEAVENYKRDKRARFQNAKYYFTCGIAVPMISSTQMTAALIENRLFDQSIVGVFPHERELALYLLAFFNSPTCNMLIRTINPTANNPANYIKKIPFVMPTLQELELINRQMEAIVDSIKGKGTYDQEREIQLNGLIDQIYGNLSALSKSSRAG